MKKFRFRFSVLLDFRKRIESQSLVAFSERQRIYQAELVNKENLRKELQAALARREGLGTLPVPAVSFRSEQDFISGIKQKMIQADHAIFRAHREMEKALRRYLEARKKTRVIELLYQKEYTEFKEGVSHAAQKELDEMILNRFHLKEDIL